MLRFSGPNAKSLRSARALASKDVCVRERLGDVVDQGLKLGVHSSELPRNAVWLTVQMSRAPQRHSRTDPRARRLHLSVSQPFEFARIKHPRQHVNRFQQRAEIGRCCR